MEAGEETKSEALRTCTDSGSCVRETKRLLFTLTVKE